MKKNTLLTIIFLLFSLKPIYCISLIPESKTDSLEDFIIFQVSVGDKPHNELWKVNSGGIFEQINLEIMNGYQGGSGLGETSPTLSNDKSQIVFINKGDLWIYYFRTRKTERISNISSPDDTLYNPITLLISGYSRDDNYLLYHLDYEVYEDEEDKPTKEFEYGFYLYSFKTKNSIKVSIPFEFIGWLNDEEILVKNDGQEYLLYNIIRSTLEVITSSNHKCNQEFIHPRGNSILSTTFYDNKENIVELDFNTNELYNIANTYGWGSLQYPKYSPDGNKISYFSHEKRGNRNIYKIITNYSTIYEYEDSQYIYLHYDWIDNNKLLIKLNTHFIVLDVSNGKIISDKYFDIK